MDQPPPVPVRQGRRRESGAHSGTTRHRTLSASAAQKKPVGEGESQLEEYCRHVEEDFVELRGAYQDQSTQLEAVETLMKESKLREEMLQAVDRRVKLTCNFLQEMVQLTTDGRGLRQREDNATNSSTKRKNQLGSLNYRSDDIMAMMDAVRDGFQKRMKELQTAREGERVNLEAAKAAEKEVQQLKRKVDSLLSSSRNRAPTSVEEDICIPASAEEVNNLRRQLNDASRQNRRTLEEVQKLTSDLKKSQQEVSVAAVRLNLQESELKELRARLESKDKLIAEAEKRYKAAEERLAQGDGPSTTNTHTRPVRGGRTQTHHYISLRGKEYAAVLKESPEEFKDSFVKSVSKLLRVSADAVTNVDLLYGGDGVSGEFDLQHNSTLEEIDYTLLRHAFPELDSLRRRGETLCKHWAVKSTASLVKELGEAHESLKFAQTNATTLNSRVRALEASLERRDVVDGEVESALLDTEKTIQDLYNALEEQNATVVSLRATVKEYEEKCNGMQSQLAEEKEMRKDSEAETDRKQALLASAELKLRAAEKEVEKTFQAAKGGAGGTPTRNDLPPVHAGRNEGQCGSADDA
ncbi:hypothetical protein ADEAN_000857100 [Angomonas deanei]|uniref:Flagellar attachment zone protein 1 conserved domain-containing protein n=1 Tax=Angomonas deanei TaxID=59799 RepID=A0A7G2CQ02_9TRYP|nr:hypothetical protein ADEAN_000857100 [Angomonas deanei]